MDIDKALANDSPKIEPKSDRRWVLWFAFVIMIVTSFPYLLGYATQGTSWRFTGFVFGVEDGNSYIAKMLSGEAGAWLFRTPYTTASQHGVIAFLPYLLLGKLASPPGLHDQLVALFQLFRIAAGVLAILATYDFLSFFIKGEALRRLALVLITLGGGLGWILVIIGKENWLGSIPLEFYSPETFGFLEIYGLPHLALARATFLWGLLAYLQTVSGEEAIRLRGVLKIGGLWLLTALSQPLTAVIMGLVIGLHMMALAAWQQWRKFTHRPSTWERWRRVFRVAVGSGCIVAPFLLYNFFVFRFDSYLSAWTKQNRIFSPHPLHYFLAYGALVPFAVVGARRLIKQNAWTGWLPIVWVLALPILAYFPFNLQRRLAEGTWVALVILAVTAFMFPNESGASWLSRKSWMFFLLLFPSTLILFAGSLLAVAHPNMPVFRPAFEVDEFNYLEQNAGSGDVVLGSYESGNALPAWAPVRVVIGHGPESVGLAELQPMVANFYQVNTTDSQRLEFLHHYDVRFVLWGPSEQDLGDWDPRQVGYLAQVFRKGNYFVFAVK